MKHFFYKIKKKILQHKIKSVCVLGLLIAYIFCLPNPLFKMPYATIVESSEGIFLGGKIADDGQWRFPERKKIPFKLKEAILTYEDAYFYRHWGINPISITKAFILNQKRNKIIRGGSTLTQQVIRLARGKKERGYWEKAVEAILATRLEFSYSKEEILALYASHAPFGGNVVGVDMAAWRYFGSRVEELSWAESALLAVLPNAPGLIHLGKNNDKLLQKRNQLLLKLYKNKKIDKETYELSLVEPLPQVPKSLPKDAYHLVEKLAKEQKGKRVRTTLNYYLQQQINQIAKNYYEAYKAMEVYNLAILVVDIPTREVLAYIGNSPTDATHQNDVNIIHSARSTGSLLKPFLYAEMLNTGELLPTELVADIPISINGFTPNNFNKNYQGAIPASTALSKSLNIPFVLLLQQYGIERFYQQLEKYQLKKINKGASHYGLSLILGGAESSLWELTQSYAQLAHELSFFNETQLYEKNAFIPISYLPQKKKQKVTSFEKQYLSAGAIYQMMEAMTEVNRTEDDVSWNYYTSSRKVSWKTGTSFGNRDAWAIGVTPNYAVGVWVGNASGEGRPELTGVEKASPILFDVFNLLPKKNWFSPPLDDMESIEICKQSGFLASPICEKIGSNVVANLSNRQLCPYHKQIHLSKDKAYQVHTDCFPASEISTESWFILPPVMEWFYKKTNAEYKELPPYHSDCISIEKRLDFIYPKYGASIYLTKDINEKEQPFIAKAAYTGKGKLFWYLDNSYLGETAEYHEFPIKTQKGNHYLKIIDEQANEKTILIIIE